MKIYKVGGAVRDKLLGLPVKDCDWVVIGSTPGEMEIAGYKPVGNDFPVFLHPDTHEEYALARTERKTAPGYKGFVFNTSTDVTLEDDLQRRDLTINAIAEDMDGNLIDPFNGKTDLEAGILRHISPAFAEDPLRVLRVARFAARFGFTVTEETCALMQKIADTDELATLVPERVWMETERALSEKQAILFFQVLRECGALAKIFPELDALFGVPQPEQYHPEIDSGIHTMMVLQQACQLSIDTTVRFAALVHDLGKGLTPKSKWPSHHGHEKTSVDLINQLCDRLRIPNKHRELAVIAARYHLDCHRISELRPDTILNKLEGMDAFRRPHRFEQFLLACEADARGRKGKEDCDYPQSELFKKLFSTAKNVNIKPAQDKQLTGTAISEEIRRLRLEAIKKHLNKS